jgi:monofunctional biosynthetic peptidoglycan transglycosylase
VTRGLSGLAVSILCVVALIAMIAAGIFLSLPDVGALKKCMTTELYHVHLCKTDPGFTSYSQISHHIVDAVIMSEDASFYSHQGIDLVEMKESFKKDMKEHRFARGASTITQQMVKNVFLSKDKSLWRKAQEIYLALEVEKVFNKQQILTFYLNVVEFGDGIYGVKAACSHYFNRMPSEISPEQAAFLAFLLPNPKKYSQSFKKRELTPFASKTVKTILNRMQKSHRLSEADYEVAMTHVGSQLWSGEVNESEIYSDHEETPTDQIGDENNSNPSEKDDEDDFKFQFDNEP